MDDRLLARRDRLRRLVTRLLGLGSLAHSREQFAASA
jgi:hypothetical protein